MFEDVTPQFLQSLLETCIDALSPGVVWGQGQGLGVTVQPGSLGDLFGLVLRGEGELKQVVGGGILVYLIQ